ncbi:MAG TPA: fibronectin type III domain-containing protein, partial [bacterium]
VLHDASIADPNTDLLTTHHYEKNPADMVAHIKESAAKARGKKPYHLGEFGFISTEGIRAVLTTIFEEDIVGGFTWSLRFHNRDGGYYWHHEPSGGDLFKAYHWPGFASGSAYDELDFMALMRKNAFAIRGLAPPPLSIPAPPELLEIGNPGKITWRGSVGASGYDIERSESANGPWHIVGRDVSDARFQYRPLFSDRGVERGKSYYYRVRARNAAGVSSPSNTVGPVQVEHLTLVDELSNNSRVFYLEGKTAFVVNQARKFKEDSHRLQGESASTATYYVPENIRGWRVYTFAPKDSANFQFYLSTDCKKFVEVEPEKISYSSGAGDYGYWMPILYKRGASGEPATYLRIMFLSDAQITRVEIDY